MYAKFFDKQCNSASFFAPPHPRCAFNPNRSLEIMSEQNLF